jgi:hypothetical protein
MAALSRRRPRKSIALQQNYHNDRQFATETATQQQMQNGTDMA